MHHMKLQPEPFRQIESGEKTIELRLLDEKRQAIEVCDDIIFTNTENGRSIKAKVIALHKFQSFTELYAALPLLKCGYSEQNLAFARASDMDAYYSHEEQRLYGVVGIELMLTKDCF